MTYLCLMIKVLARILVVILFLFIPRLGGHPTLLSGSKSFTSVAPELSLENVYRELLFRDIKHPEVVLRQVIWETQWLNCKNCTLKFNNLFGFATSNGQMKFDKWTDCIDFYKQWQIRHKIDAEKDYYEQLRKAHFATYVHYNKRLKSLNIGFILEKFETANPGL